MRAQFINFLVLGVLLGAAEVRAEDQISERDLSPQVTQVSFEQQNAELKLKEAELVRKIKDSGDVPNLDGTSDNAEVEEVDFKASLNSKQIDPAKTEESKTNTDKADGGKKIIVKPKSAVDPSAQVVSSLTRSKNELEAKLKASENQINQLRQELEQARNRLMIADTEVARLSAVMKDRYLEPVLRGGSRLNSQESAARAPSVKETRSSTLTQTGAEDMDIATVIVDKANLRVGPGEDNSPLMTVSRGTRLTVEGRQGDWYRVNTPSGARAWVDSKVVSFAKQGAGRPSTLTIRGFDPSLEHKAYESSKSVGGN